MHHLLRSGHASGKQMVRSETHPTRRHGKVQGHGYLSISNALSGHAVSNTSIKDKAILKKVITQKRGLF
jgi:hypothetical protein